MALRRCCGVLLLIAALAACGERGEDGAGPAPADFAAGANVDGARIAAADQEPGSWLAHGRTYDEQRYTPLAKIDRSNVASLGLAWSFELGSTRGVEATPIVADGVMYLTGPWSVVYALDATTGKQRWKYDPAVPGDWGRQACCDVVNRGVAVWKGSVFVGTLDGRLVALDAASGTPRWEVLTVDRNRSYTITGAPRVVKDKVIIGNGGADLGVRGYVTAYDARTGAQVWRFYTVPGDPSKPFENKELEQAATTWTGKWWEVGGGGTAWDSMAYDPELDLLYVGTGNGAPWTRYQRSPGGGDNLFLSSILALRPDSGELVWYYQTTPGDNWDYTATQHIVLAELTIDGAARKVLMQAPKNGFFYVLDRATGKLLSAAPYVAMNWASGVDLATGRPVETDAGNYAKEAKLVFPGPHGAHSWHPMSFHPGTGLVYLPVMDVQFWYANDPRFQYRFGTWAIALDTDQITAKTEEKAPEMKGLLLAWDPVAGQPRWRVDLAGYWNGGTLATAGGLVFQGTGDGLFRAYDAETGAVLWEAHSQTGIMAPPISYEQSGEQYVAVAAGFGGVGLTSNVPSAIINDYHNQGRMLVFKLGGSPELPPSKARDRRMPPPPVVEASADELARGKSLYHRHCQFCHGFQAVSSWVVPDLRYLRPERHSAFADIVLEGMFSGKGMPAFAGLLTLADVRHIQAYVVREARKAYEEQTRPKD